MMLEPSRMVSFSGRVYALLLLAYPARFRREYGPEMAQVFRDDLHGTLRNKGTSGLVGLWFLVVFDLSKTAFAEHLWEVFHMPIEKFSRWTGLAAALGGALMVYLFIRTEEPDIATIFWGLIPMTLCWAIALTGLYRRLPAGSHPANKIMLGLSLLSIAVLLVGLALLQVPEADYAWGMLLVGFFGLIFGLAGMGIITWGFRTLGVWRFVPLLLAGTLLGFLLTGSEADTVDNPVQLTFLILHGLGWLLLGIALWMQPENVPGPALPA